MIAKSSATISGMKNINTAVSAATSANRSAV